MQSPAALAETHISVVFFVGDRAYKLKKPVRFGFLDFSTPALRLAACRREVELNRRLEPDVYLGVAEVRGPEGAVCDHLVVMRRMPAERRLSTLVTEQEDVEDALRRVARVIAAFQDTARTSPEIAAAASRDALRGRWERTFDELEPFVGEPLDPQEFERVVALAHRYLDGRNELFEDRIARRRVRDGHGDLRAEDIFCLPDGPRILDCLEFDDELRSVDVLDDVAFLAMDLEHLGSPALADRFLSWWTEFSAESHPPSLAHHYVAYRAVVRAKVACLRAQQGDPAVSGEATELLELARRHLELARVTLVLVGGLPGTGKTTLADALGADRDWTVLRSDVRRKELAGMAPEVPAAAPFRVGLYDAEATAATYATMLDDAERALRRGESVVLDASWTSDRWRKVARLVAERTASDLVELRCDAPVEVAEDRIRRRRGDASDATVEIAAAMRSAIGPWPEASVIDTSGFLTSAVAQARAAIEAS